MSRAYAALLSSGLVLMSGGTSAKGAREKATKQYVVVNEEVGVPVFDDDIIDRPYTVVGQVKAGVRKAKSIGSCGNGPRRWAPMRLSTPGTATRTSLP